jgi:hypothetical protein
LPSSSFTTSFASLLWRYVIQNLLHSLWISHSSATMHPQPPQFIIGAPFVTIILRRLPHTRSTSRILQRWPPCIPAVNESNAQPI